MYLDSLGFSLLIMLWRVVVNTKFLVISRMNHAIFVYYYARKKFRTF